MKYFLLISSIICTQLSFAQKHYILALSKGDKKVVVFDYATLDSITSIPVIEDPHEIVTDEKGAFAYISHPLLNNNGHSISVINLKTLKVEQPVDTAPFYIPHGLAYQNNKLWITAQGSKSVILYDLKSRQVESVFGTGQDFTHLITVNSEGNRFYTTNVESGTLSIYERKEIPPYMPPTGVLPPNAKPRLEWRQTLVDVGLGAEGFDVSPDGKELWTARPDGYIIIVDLLKKEIRAKIDTKVLGLHRIRFTPDGKSVAVVSVKTGDLLFYNTQTYKQEQKMNIGQGAGIFMDAPGNRMFISCTPNNYIVVIGLKTREEIKRLSITRPDAVTSVLVQ